MDPGGGLQAHGVRPRTRQKVVGHIEVHARSHRTRSQEQIPEPFEALHQAQRHQAIQGPKVRNQEAINQPHQENMPEATGGLGPERRVLRRSGGSREPGRTPQEGEAP